MASPLHKKILSRSPGCLFACVGAQMLALLSDRRAYPSSCWMRNLIRQRGLWTKAARFGCGKSILHAVVRSELRTHKLPVNHLQQCLSPNMPLITSSVTCVKLEHGGRTYRVALGQRWPEVAWWCPGTNLFALVTCWSTCVHSIICKHTLSRTRGDSAWLALVVCVCVCMWLSGGRGSRVPVWIHLSCEHTWMYWQWHTHTTDVPVMLEAWRWNWTQLTGFDPGSPWLAVGIER